jgi:CCR4-NOT transcriptional complex subunit CAF120
MGNKPKERKVPVLAMKEITQVFAMYPERPEMMSISTLMKVEGLLGDEAVAGGMRNREAWMMVMPATETGSTPAVGMLKWIMGTSMLWYFNSKLRVMIDFLNSFS